MQYVCRGGQNSLVKAQFELWYTDVSAYSGIFVLVCVCVCVCVCLDTFMFVTRGRVLPCILDGWWPRVRERTSTEFIKGLSGENKQSHIAHVGEYLLFTL